MNGWDLVQFGPKSEDSLPGHPHARQNIFVVGMNAVAKSPRSYVVGSVPYVNGRPLVLTLEGSAGLSPIRVVYEVPSKLERMLALGEADAVLASSIASFEVGRKVAAEVCIASEGAVESVRLFSKVPFDRIATLALDQSSLTSNALAQIVLAESYGVRPAVQPEPPDLAQMLARHDAGVLIGDIGMRANGSGLHVLDLGEAWTALTGLPFVWALWIGGQGFDEPLARMLAEAKRESRLGADAIVAPEDEPLRDAHLRQIAGLCGWPFEDVRRYLTRTISFSFGERARFGLREFARRLREHGLASKPEFPELVGELPTSSGAVR